MNGLGKFTTKYNTPRIVQIFYTLLCVAVAVLVSQGSLRASMAGTIGGYKCGTILSVFYYIAGMKYSYFFDHTINYIFIGIGILGIIFIWMNRPKLAATTPAIYLIILLLTLFKKDYGDYYVEYNSYAQKDIFETLTWGREYTYAWIALIIFIVLAIIAILVTKKGARPPKTVRIVNLPKSVDETADDLMKYKELLDSGVISQEEFDAKKKQLLGL